MKPLWNAISFLAIVHLLALLMFVAWLWNSGRLDKDRITDLRQFLSMTTAEAKTAASKALVDAEAQRLQTAQEQATKSPPTDSETQIRRLTLMSQQEEQTRRRLTDERRTLQLQLDQVAAKSIEQQAAFDKQRLAWENSVKADRVQKTDVQFQQAVKLYEQAQPKQAKKMLQHLIEQQQIDRAVEYLDAMNVRAASKVLKEFKTDEEIKVATELLEKLRTLGQPAEVASDSPGTIHAANAPSNPISAGQGVAVAP